MEKDVHTMIKQPDFASISDQSFQWRSVGRDFSTAAQVFSVPISIAWFLQQSLAGGTKFVEFCSRINNKAGKNSRRYGTKHRRCEIFHLDSEQLARFLVRY
ncbi:hypothetical protein RRG08_039730 [Elysia crispata]|uniref:Uncharacterized protein n=1 Tax=Elysia crispata TaxID=231223 RepID=A0AAE1CVA5_9GAST|nr:hypothetical protein RRG08_039730 [Elysia crispata]